MTKDLPIYKITIEDEYADGENLGIEMIAFTKMPAIKVKGMAFNSEKKMMYNTFAWVCCLADVQVSNIPVSQLCDLRYRCARRIRMRA